MEFMMMGGFVLVW